MIVLYVLNLILLRACFGMPVHFIKEDFVEEVPEGKLITLHCHSNDQDHNFLFWLLGKDIVIGPGNAYNYSVYEYEVLTGDLVIKKVSSDHDGIYKCVSQGIQTEDINIRTIRVVVKKDWEEIWVYDHSVNFFRIVVVLGVLIIIFGGSFLVYKSWTNKRNTPVYLDINDDDEDDSGEDVFNAPSTSKGIIIEKYKDVLEAPVLSTDFGSILDSSEK